MKTYQEFVKSLTLSSEVQDLNEELDYDEFDASAVQVIVKGVGMGAVYQVSETYDAGCISSTLSANYESGALSVIEKAMREFFDDEYIDENLFECADLIAKESGAQEIFNDYMHAIGVWESDMRMDANSEKFVKVEA